MNLFKKHKKSEQCVDQSKNKQDEKMRRTMHTIEKTVGNRNPMSKGQGYSGDSKVAMLQMMRNDD